MNMLALRCGDDIIVIDAGMMFPGGELLGVDIVVPDVTYLLDNQDKLRGLVLPWARRFWAMETSKSDAPPPPISAGMTMEL